MKARGSSSQMVWSRMDYFPPIFCRLLARRPRGPVLESAELAARTGLTVYQIDTISQQTNWDGIDIPTARKFMQACGTDPANPAHCRRVRMYLRNRPKHRDGRFLHLKSSKNWKSHFLPLLIKLERYVLSKSRRENE